MENLTLLGYSRAKKSTNKSNRAKSDLIGNEKKGISKISMLKSSVSFSLEEELIIEVVKKESPRKNLIKSPKFGSPKFDKYQELSKAIDNYREYLPKNYIESLEEVETDTIKYMSNLQSKFELYLGTLENLEEAFIPVLRILDTTYAWLTNMEEVINWKTTEKQEEAKNDVLVIAEKIKFKVTWTLNRILSKCLNETLIDWRIGKKLLCILRAKKDFMGIVIDPIQLLNVFENEILRALDFLSWKNKDHNYRYTTWTLNNLRKLLSKDLLYIRENSLTYEQLIDRSEPPIQNRFINAIITGRFDKNIFGLENSLILGEDGGLYMLLNNRNYLTDLLLTCNNSVSKQFLESKSFVKENTKTMKNQLKLGSGNFGKVKFGFSLFVSEKTSPGNIICLKKSNSFAQLMTRNKKMTEGETIFDITENTLKDYFAGDVAEIMNAPGIIDLALVSDPSVGGNHRKGYLMMEVVPQKTGTLTFRTEKYQKWEYQKPFLLDIFEGTQKALSFNIVQTDLKLDNTLFDPITRKGTIIDLGGILKMDNPEEVKNFDPSQGGYDTTVGYFAPELNPSNETPIDLNLSLLFTCGVILKRVTLKTDLPTESIETINKIVERTTSINPLERGSFDDLISDIIKIGDDKYKETVLKRGYIAGIIEKIEKNRASISLNEEILTTKQVLINIEVTKQNPYYLKNQVKENLFDLIDDFFENYKQQVFLILGSAGSGKSIALQLKFIEAAYSWEGGKPLPIYINLANETSLEKNFENLKKGLGVDLDPNNAYVNLYLDSFDEGFDMESKRDKLIKYYVSVLGARSKILVSCRTDYLESEDDIVWFQTESNNLSYYYITPFNYDHTKDLKSLAKKWLDIKGKMQLKKLNMSQNEKLLQLIEMKEIKSMIDTAFIFDIVMTTIPVYLSSNNYTDFQLTKTLLFNLYIENYIENMVLKLSSKQQQKLKLIVEKALSSLPYKLNLKGLVHHISKKTSMKIFPSNSRNRRKSITKEIQDTWMKLTSAIEVLGIYLAFEIYQTRKFRIDCSTSPIFKVFGYQSSRPFKDQDIYYALNLLPMKIETRLNHKKGNLIYEVQTAFSHEVIKDLFLYKAIDYELRHSEISQILSFNNISRNVELVRLLIDSLEDVHKPKLRKFINKSKLYKSREIATLAANSITILVAMGETFIKQDLSNVNIQGANLHNGVFQKTNFEGACLRGVELSDAILNQCNFKGADLGGINLGIYPNLKLKEIPFLISFSFDGNTITSYHNSKNLLTLHDLNSGKELNRKYFNKNNKKTTICHALSASGTILAIGFDNHIDIWDLEKLNKSNKLTLKNTKTDYSLMFNINHEILTVNLLKDKNKLVIQEIENDLDPFEKIFDLSSFSQLLDVPEGQKVQCFPSSCGRKIAISAVKKINKTENCDTNSYLIMIDINKSQIYTIKLEGKLSTLAFSKDADTITVGCDDEKYSLSLYNIKGEGNQTLLKRFKGQTSTVSKIMYFPDGKRILGGSKDHCVRVWDILSGNLLQSLLGLTNTVVSLAFSFDGNKFAAGDLNSNLMVWDSNIGEFYKKLDSHTSSVTGISFSPDSKIFASSSLDNTVRIWETDSGKQLFNIKPHKDSINALAFSPDGEVIATACFDGKVYLWKVKSGDKITAFEAHSSKVYSLAYSSDGRNLATGGEDCKFKIWDSKSCNLVLEKEHHQGPVVNIEFVNEFLATGSIDRSLKLWNSHGFLVLNICFKAEVTCFKFDSSIQTIYASSGSKVYILNLEKYLHESKLDSNNTLEIDPETSKKIETDSNISCLAIGANNDYIVVGNDKNISIYNSKKGVIFQTIRGHFFNISAVNLSKDGTIILSGSEDGMIGLWTNNKKSIKRARSSSVWNYNEGDFDHSSESSGCISDISYQNGVIEEEEYSQSQDDEESSKDSNSDLGRILMDIDKKDYIGSSDMKELASDDKKNEVHLYQEEKKKNITPRTNSKVYNTQENESQYMLKFFTSKHENNLSAKNMILEDAIISKVDELVFLQSGAKVGVNNLIEGIAKGLSKSSLVSSEFLTKNSTFNIKIKKTPNFIPCKILPTELKAIYPLYWATVNWSDMKIKLIKKLK